MERVLKALNCIFFILRGTFTCNKTLKITDIMRHLSIMLFIIQPGIGI